ncbi:sensor histidine kinase [Ammoniphilus sp. CFH 90114]|uniref:sensor histidine kinase n=1 Tax=Ammoniphilus sp. CFH 90114 TaxID=2493665 RepID=UPI0013E91086|nr:ATP-binding protein [Ammoniphilus sp. CFH 90114]
MTLTTLVVYSIPEAFALACLGLFTTRTKLTERLKSIFIFAVLWALQCYFWWHIDELDAVFRMLIQLPILIILAKLVFKELSWLMSILYFLLAYFIIVLSEIIGLHILGMLNIPLDVFFSTEFNKALFGLKNFLIIGICFVLNRMNVRMFTSIELLGLPNQVKHHIIFLTIVIAQLLLLSFLNVSLARWNFIDGQALITMISISSAVLLFLSFYYVHVVRKSINQEWENQASQLLQSNITHLFLELRTQRHDFQNHLQTIHGLLYLDKYKEAKNYIKEMGSELQAVNSYMCRNPILTSILFSKGNQFREQGVELKAVLESHLEETSVSSVHLIHIIGNLLDNAKDAVLSVDGRSSRTVELVTKKMGNEVLIQVKNQYPAISSSLLDKVFEKGFSTKGTDGLGLTIVKQYVEQNQGRILVHSDNERGTVFSVYLPVVQEREMIV